ncbi:hypothetical protein BDV96DRAFT_506024 [Lophiotrema nucula]|uniref:Uncharacterized protein n=1 Tax=Lophiotrema nucula TaxID=690887 RepID=A0A6A5YMZ1_9PLEO|nr:hypothetical protein BDV96DRAFT_506024 [Lophiotrema nucula]
MSVARRASTQLLAPRSVHLRIQPRPANLSESREIYRVLQRFGEISMYRYLRYEYHSPVDNAAMAIYRDPESARKALSASPIRFALERVTTDDGGQDTESQQRSDEAQQDRAMHETPMGNGVEEMLRPSQLINRPLPDTTTSPVETDVLLGRSERTTPPMPFEDTLKPRETTSKWFQVTVDTSHAVMQDHAERQPYWKQFSPLKSMAQQDLAKSVPHIGLSDVSKRPMHQHRTPNKVLNQMSRYVEHHMPTLRMMYEEGGREEKKEDRPI